MSTLSAKVVANVGKGPTRRCLHNQRVGTKGGAGGTRTVAVVGNRQQQEGNPRFLYLNSML